jgi:hypothetical protein
MAVDFAAKVIEPALRVFGVDVAYTPIGGSAATVRGIFDNAHREVILPGADGLAISTTGPRLDVLLTSIPNGPSRGDTFAHEGVTYRVNDVQPDGQGGARLVLEIVSGG